MREGPVAGAVLGSARKPDDHGSLGRSLSASSDWHGVYHGRVGGYPAVRRGVLHLACERARSWLHLGGHGSPPRVATGEIGRTPLVQRACPISMRCSLTR